MAYTTNTELKTYASISDTVHDTPLAFTRDHGQAFTAYVQGNDAAAALTLGYAGWLEEE